MLEKDELMKAVWPDSFVEEGNLTRNISTLRAALGEHDDDHQYIETVPKLGYRFVAEVTEFAEDVELIVEEKTRARIVIDEEEHPSSNGRVVTVDQPAIPTGRRLAVAVKRHLSIAVLAVLVLGVAVLGVVYFTKPGEAIDSIAVMPFVNVSGDPNTEYLSDGLSDSIIKSLSQMPNLKVIALNSVLRYKGKQTDPQVAGRELNVRAVLMGRLIQQGDSLSISTELVDVRDNRRLWGEQYNRKLADIAVVQTDIAQEISERLRLRLSGEEKKRLAKRYTDNVEAYQLYLMGRSYIAPTSEKGLQKSIELYEQAIKKDPNYAPAYAGLSMDYETVGYTGLWPAKEARQKQELFALKALEIDDQFAEAHVVVALVRRVELNWSSSEDEHKRALELDPNSVLAHVTYAYHLAWLGRLDEAMPHVRRAQELDPLSLITSAEIGNMFYCSRQYDRAIEQFQKIIELDPNFPPAHSRLGMVYVEKGMYEEAIAEHKKAIALDDSPRRTALLGHAYAVAGRKAEAQKILDDLKELAKQRYVSPFDFALVYMGLGDKDQAFVWLEKTSEERPDTLWDINVGSRFDSLRSDPRFTDLLRRMKLA
jgi:TolB-like protein